jgi:hypothetical protein
MTLLINGVQLLGIQFSKFTNWVVQARAEYQLYIKFMKGGVLTIDDVTNSLKGNTAELRRFQSVLDTVNKTQKRSTELAGMQKVATNDLIKTSAKLIDSLNIFSNKRIEEEKKALEKSKAFTTQRGDHEIATAEKSKQTRIDIIKEYLAFVKSSIELELDMEEQKYSEMMDKARRFNLSEEEIELKHQENIVSIKEKSLKQVARKQDLATRRFIANLGIEKDSYSTFSNFMLNNLDKTSKSQFKVWKAFSIQQAIMDTYRAANAGYAALAGIPVVGPILGAAAASAAIGIGLARVNQIRQTKFQGAESGALVRGSPSGTTVLTGERNKDELIVPFENEEVMGRVRESFGGGGGTLHIENFYAIGDAEEMAMSIDRQLYKLRQDSNSTFATAIEGE